MLQVSIHPAFPNHPQILQRGFPMRILRSVAVFLLHDILAGIIRTFVAVFIAIFSPLPTEDYATMHRTKLRLVIIRSIAPLTRIILNQSLRTDITVQSTWSYHFRFEHLFSSSA